MTDVSTAVGSIVLIDQNQEDAEVVANDAFDGLDAMSYMAMRGNRVINSSLQSWQEGTSFAAIASGGKFADMFRYSSAGVAVVTIARSTDTPSNDVPFSIFVDVTTIDATIGAADTYELLYKVEGLDIRDALLGTSAARVMSLVFEVKSSKTGIYCVSFRNSAANRSYVVEYTVDAANTWETKLITLTGDLTGTWLVDENIGLHLSWALGNGTNFQGTPNQWNAANDLATSNQVNFMDNTANEFRLADPRLYVGRIPTNAVGFPVAERGEGAELRRIGRYFQRIDSEAASQQFGVGQCRSTTTAVVPISYLPKRITPTISVSAAGDFDVEQANGTLQAVTVLAGADIGLSRAEMDVTVAANLVAGNATVLRDDAGNNAFIDIDARL